MTRLWRNGMSMRKRIILSLVGVALLILLILAFRPRPIAVDTAMVEYGPLSVTVDQHGVTRVRDRFAVFAPVAGQLERIDLRVGDPIEQSDTVARIAAPLPGLLDGRTRAQGEAYLARALAALEQVDAERDGAAATAQLAERRFERVRRQFAFDDVAEAEFELARAQALEARANLRAAEFAVAAAQHDVAAVEALLRDTAYDDESGVVTVTAPVAGRILAIHRRSAGAIGAGEPLLEIGDPTALEVAVDVLSADAVKIRPGMAVRLHGWGGADLDAAVRTIEPAGFTEVSALGVEEQRVTVIADLLSPPEAWERLGDDYRVEASFLLWHDDEVLQVPEGALFRHQDGWAVFVMDGGRAGLRQVEVGQRADLRAQILSGLDAGEVVVVHPADAIGDGSRIVRR